MERGSAQDPPPSGLFPAAQKVLQQRWYISEPLVARRCSVDKPLGRPCGAFVDDWELTRGGGAKRKKPGTEKVLVGTRLLAGVTSAEPRLKHNRTQGKVSQGIKKYIFYRIHTGYSGTQITH